MRRFKNILLVAEGPKPEVRPLERAVSLAAANEGRLTIVAAVDRLPKQTRVPASVMPPERLEQLIVDARRAELEDMAVRAQEEGVAAEAAVLRGTAFIEIIRKVVRDGHDLVIMPAEQPHGLKQALFAPTGWHLLRKCPSPVWIIKPESAPRFGRILAAVDVSRESEDTDNLSRKILQLASSLAEIDGADLHIVHAWQLWMERALRGRARMRESDLEEMAAVQEQHSRERVDALLAESGVAPDAATVHLLRGEPGEVIPLAAHDLQADLAVMGTVSRTGIAGLLIGNTAERILHALDCSVLTVKPDGFQTPIRLQDPGSAAV